MAHGMPRDAAYLDMELLRICVASFLNERPTTSPYEDFRKRKIEQRWTNRYFAHQMVCRIVKELPCACLGACHFVPIPSRITKFLDIWCLVAYCKKTHHAYRIGIGYFSWCWSSLCGIHHCSSGIENTYSAAQSPFPDHTVFGQYSTSKWQPINWACRSLNVVET